MELSIQIEIQMQWLLSMQGFEQLGGEYEDLSPSYWLHDYELDIDLDHNRVSWLITIMLIYKCLVGELIKVWPEEYLVNKETYDDFLFHLLQEYPNESFNQTGKSFWLEPLLYATEKCQKLVKEYNLSYAQSSLNYDFCKKVFQIFSTCDVTSSEVANKINQMTDFKYLRETQILKLLP